MDELLMYTALSYFLTVFSHAYDHREQNTKRRVNRLLDLLQIQGKERTIDVRNLQDVLEMITLPRNVLDLAMDCFWSARTFMVGHEIYHLIRAQKTGDMPEEIRGFDENIYLSPVILFEHFDLLDEYGALTGKAVSSADHPSPRERQEHIFDLFDDIPEELNT